MNEDNLDNKCFTVIEISILQIGESWIKEISFKLCQNSMKNETILFFLNTEKLSNRFDLIYQNFHDDLNKRQL